MVSASSALSSVFCYRGLAPALGAVDRSAVVVTEKLGAVLCQNSAHLK